MSPLGVGRAARKKKSAVAHAIGVVHPGVPLNDTSGFFPRLERKLKQIAKGNDWVGVLSVGS